MQRLKLTMMILTAIGFAAFSVSPARGDIYAWTDENGVKYFTNHAPPKQATLFMKTPEIPYDEEADKQRREMDRLEVARHELAEREAFLLEQQQQAERRLAEANARAEAALQEADRILQDAEAAAEGAGYNRSSSYVYGYNPGYLYKGYYRNWGLYHKKKHHYKHKKHFYKHKGHYNKTKKYRYGHSGKSYSRPSYYSRHHRKLVTGRRSFEHRSRGLSHRSRSAAFRGRHGGRF